MKKLLILIGALSAIGLGTAHAQQISLDEAIRSAAEQFSARLDEGAKVGISMQAETAGLSNYLIGEMTTAFILGGVSSVTRFYLEPSVQFVVSGTFEAAEDFFRFNARLIETADYAVRSTYTANVRSDGLITSLLGGSAQFFDPPPPPPPYRSRHELRRELRHELRREQGRVNWLSAEISVLGVGIRYERDINRFLSIGGYFYFEGLGIVMGAGYDLHITLGVMATARFFPLSFLPRFSAGSPLYIELGMGWSDPSELRWVGWSVWDYSTQTNTHFQAQDGFTMTPAIGARFGGRRRAFFVNPFISFPILFSERQRFVPEIVEGGSPWDVSGTWVPDGGNVTRFLRFGVNIGGAW